MRFTPLSAEEAEAAASGTWPNGIYDYEVSEAEETVSKNSGNEMFALKLWIFNKSGERKLIDDWLTLTVKSAWKLRHFADSCGLTKQYEGGALVESEMVGRGGRCSIITQAAEGAFPAKNKVKDYLAAAAPSSPSRQMPNDLDDEVPF